jgi:iron complex outermembrane recepter protein
MLVNGVPTCVTTPGVASTRIAGCVPLNLLGAPGSITQDMLDFSSFIAHDQLGYEMLDYFANIYGDLFELPGGNAGFAFGLEHRAENGFDSPDALISSGNTTGNARTPTEGKYSLDEAYLELALPLLADVTFAQQLEVSLATRYSDYSNFGDTTNSKIGIKWKPIDDLLVRGSYSEGFRAPAIGELFAGVADAFPPITDPCTNAAALGNPYARLTPEQQARCSGQGVPVGGYDQGNPQIRISVGGNADLTPEESISKTLGVVYSPSYLEGFDVSVDWWQIELDNTITALTGQFILDECTLRGNANACTLFSRNLDGSIGNLLSAGLNIGSQEVEGFDVNFNYKLADTRFGTFSASLDNSYIVRDQSDLDLDGRLDDSVTGEYPQAFVNNWRLRSNLSTRWSMGDWGATWNVRYFSRQEEVCPLIDTGFDDLCSDITNIGVGGVPAPENSIGGTTYNDISGYWNTPWNSRITVGVNNVFDKDPPVVFNAFANSFDPQYEIPGRFYYLQYSQSF